MISWGEAVALVAVDWEAEMPQAEIAALPGLATPRSITLAGDLLAVALGEAGASVLDGSAWPPRVVSMVAGPSAVERAVIAEGMLVTAESACGLRVYDLTQPEAPVEVGFLRTGHAADLLDAGDAILLAAGPELITARFNPAAPAGSPALPQSPSPANGEMGLTSEPVLAWGPGADPCDPLSYEVYFGAGDAPPLAGRISGDPALQVSDLAPLTTYSWHVRAIDLRGNATEGPTWQFTTAADLSDEARPPSPPLFGVFSGDRLALPAILLLLFMLVSGLTVLFRRRGTPGGD